MKWVKLIPNLVRKKASPRARACAGTKGTGSASWQTSSGKSDPWCSPVDMVGAVTRKNVQCWLDCMSFSLSVLCRLTGKVDMKDK